jgi:hypothetical protein
LGTGGGGGGGAGGGATTPKWKAAIDFKWIRDNRDAVATNILNRNSVANLDVVLQLYDQYLALQKVRGLPVIATAALRIPFLDCIALERVASMAMRMILLGIELL